ncbi:MAG TPA: serine hydroxymethyltransferase [Rhizomicrobium sp.]|jgi:glycine hydroxymethyltransferase|nr:serine hydroxymethyltransferase [Rhizomicrobium sp.]
MDAHRAALHSTDPDIDAAIAGEERRQVDGVEMIPSENYTYPEVLAALGSVLTNKYSEGYPGRRYYGGQEFTDRIETLARDRACALFRAEHANVQPLSGSPMNQAAYFAFLEPGDTVLAMDLSHGGHLTHGAPVSHMGKVFKFERYKSETAQGGAIDFDGLMARAKQTRPKLVLCGYSSYPRDYDYAAFKAVADEVGALTMADISHIGGLVAADAMRNPLDAGFDVVTTTTHKSLRGPRGGLILCKAAHAKKIDAAVFPGLQGGPHMNNVAGAAITFRKAAEPAFRDYALAILRNAKALARALMDEDVKLITDGTDNHLLVIDTVASFGLDGRAAEEALDRIGLTTNKQIIPDDPRPPLRPSGIRLGTPACTTRGMDTDDMRAIAMWLVATLRSPGDAAATAKTRAAVREMCRRYPVPGIAL